MFNIEFDKSKQFKKDLEKLNKDLIKKKKVKIFLEKLSKNPFSDFLNIKKLQPKSSNKFRLRVDDYRIIYSINSWKNIVLVHRIGLRKDIYK